MFSNGPLQVELADTDFQFSMPFGLEMVNDVIIKPYRVRVDTTHDRLKDDHDESFLVLIDRNGKWKVNTLLKGFATTLQGFASSYSNMGDILLIGKDKNEMKKAYEAIKTQGGGIAVSQDGKITAKIDLPIGGGLSTHPVSELIEIEKVLKEELAAHGFHHGDAIYTLLFLQATHLPYVRVTQRGIVDVLKKQVLFPSVMR